MIKILVMHPQNFPTAKIITFTVCILLLVETSHTYVIYCALPDHYANIFRAQEPKAPVTYCDHALSIVRRPSSVVHWTIYIFDFFSRTTWWILMKLGMDEVLKVPYKCCCFSTRSVQGRIQGGAKIGHGGSPSSGNFFFRPEGYSNKPNA